MDGKTKKKPSQAVELLALLCGLFVLLNIALLYFLRTQVKTIGLLRQQSLQLEQDQQIVNSAETIYQQHKNDIDAIAQVFPNESTVLDFLQTLEDMAKADSDNSTVKLASDPLPEGDKLFLLFTVTMKTDTTRLPSFLDALEKLPYMTHVISMSISWEDKAKGTISASLRLKLYVKNPFAAQ